MSTGLTSVEPNLRSPVLRALARPRAVALACIAVLIAVGWAYLGVLLAAQSTQGILSALCQPLYGLAGSSSPTAFLLTFPMWCAMALAMMLPTAGPMIMTYADIAEAAAAKGEPVASPLALTAGYTVVWLATALVLAALQALLMRAAALDDTITLTSLLLSGALFVAAGLYQFSAMKRACLTQCQHPFTFFFANWTPRPRGVFGLGVRQGLYCVGCCWSMMLLMFAVGIMSVIWMALLGAVMAIEKIGSTMRFSHAMGAIFLAAGSAMIAASVVAHWPAKIG